MDNKIDKIITLQNGNKYYIVNQGVYLENVYYFVVKVNDEETEFLNEGHIVEQISDNPLQLIKVSDPELLEVLMKHLMFNQEEA